MTSENATEHGDESDSEDYGIAQRPSSMPSDLGDLAETERRNISRFIATGIEMSISAGSPIASKINESHLTDLIGLSGKELEYEHADRHRSRVFWGIMAAFVILVCVAFAIFLAVQGMDGLLAELVKGGALFLSGAAAGFGGGYGLARRNR